MSDTTDPEYLEPDPEDDELLLADPDDYHQAQRLREIHDARRHVHKVIRNIERWSVSKRHAKQQRNLTDAVIAYYTELEPLIRRSNTKIKLPHDFPFDTADQFATTLGTHPEEGQPAGYNESQLVFRKLNQFLAEVKPLIEQDDTDEWEV